ncbi:double-stranded RNA-binding protein Staufen homolog 1-like [Actinia tenebrosa]|uniref:Double-stranded RNA-binding protein Staufen homolog 1-like n=1 Tax=Actinia tenebrosa TaxID=6105 RepID=A0A6P8IX12_ACTTE|nr:double-stranded RNA-binding protein Staufen homolog 1-like [Actinia tenebrosa]
MSGPPTTLAQQCTTSTDTPAEPSVIGPMPPVNPSPKSPISELMEICMRMGIDVTFTVISEIGPPHNKEFVISCSAGNIIGQGKEYNKKKAKHLAAADALKKLQESEEYKNYLFNRSTKAAAPSHYNVVGQLQEAIAKKGLQLPQYEFDQPIGPPHKRQFVTKVQVGNLTASGSGRSKKEAKRSAAAAMLDNLNCSNLSLHVPAKKIAFKPASSAIDPTPILFKSGGTL